MKFDDLLTGFIRLHILHHAAEMEIYGQWMIDELARHGYPGTLYPMLHAMQREARGTVPSHHRATELQPEPGENKGHDQ
jgi:DNA-binding PadR family transcriptional regulator